VRFGSWTVLAVAVGQGCVRSRRPLSGLSVRSISGCLYRLAMSAESLLGQAPASADEVAARAVFVATDDRRLPGRHEADRETA